MASPIRASDLAGRTLKDRFWHYTAKSSPDECWLWRGPISGPTTKYGVLIAGFGNYRRVKAHHLSWLIHYGDIPDHKLILHKCNNGLCVNPAHLKAGTYAENAQDSLSARTWGNQYHKGMGAKGTNKEY